MQDKLREMLHRTDQGLPVVPEQETVGTFLHRWLEFKKAELRPRSYESYEQLVRAHLLPGLERVRLAKPTPFDVSAWFRRHHAEGAGARTIQYARAVLRAALNQAARWGLVARNAAALSDAPRHEARENTAAVSRAGEDAPGVGRRPSPGSAHHRRGRTRGCGAEKPSAFDGMTLT